MVRPPRTAFCQETWSERLPNTSQSNARVSSKSSLTRCCGSAEFKPYHIVTVHLFHDLQERLSTTLPSVSFGYQPRRLRVVVLGATPRNPKTKEDLLSGLQKIDGPFQILPNAVPTVVGAAKLLTHGVNTFQHSHKGLTSCLYQRIYRTRFLLNTSTLWRAAVVLLWMAR